MKEHVLPCLFANGALGAPFTVTAIAVTNQKEFLTCAFVRKLISWRLLPRVPAYVSVQWRQHACRLGAWALCLSLLHLQWGMRVCLGRPDAALCSMHCGLGFTIGTPKAVCLASTADACLKGQNHSTLLSKLQLGAVSSFLTHYSLLIIHGGLV